MATEDRTHASQPGPVLSYLGHPCQLDPLIGDRHGDEQFARLKTEDPRHLAQLLGDELATQQHRAETARIAAEQLAQLARGGADHNSIQAVAEVLQDFLASSSHHVWTTTTLTLATLHRADLIAPSQQQRAEAAHG